MDSKLYNRTGRSGPNSNLLKLKVLAVVLVVTCWGSVRQGSAETVAAAPVEPTSPQSSPNRLIKTTTKSQPHEVALTIANTIQTPDKLVSPNTTVIVHAPRALRDSLWMLAQQLGCVINYEDPTFGHADAVEELYPIKPIALAPRSRTVRFTYEPPDRDSAHKAIESLLHQYHQMDDTARFKVEGSSPWPRLYNVLPVSYRNKAGEMVDHTSLLDVKVPGHDTNLAFSVAAQRIADLASAKDGTKLWLGRLPIKTGKGNILTGRQQHSALECLTDHVIGKFNSDVRDTNSQLSWSISVDPTSDFRVINFHVVQAQLEPLDGLISVRVEARRPLFSQLEIFRDHFGVASIYEDPPFSCPCDVMVSKAGKTLGLRGGILTHSFRSGSDVLEVIESSLGAYHRQHNPGRFQAQSKAGVVCVFPRAFKNKRDVWVDHVPVMERKISIYAKEESVADLIERWCTASSVNADVTIETGELPTGLEQLISYKAENQSAYQCLIDWSKAVGRNLSWRLLYDVRTKEYRLDVVDQTNRARETGIEKH